MRVCNFSTQQLMMYTNVFGAILVLPPLLVSGQAAAALDTIRHGTDVGALLALYGITT